jgi:hypothetical protein
MNAAAKRFHIRTYRRISLQVTAFLLNEHFRARGFVLESLAGALPGRR